MVSSEDFSFPKITNPLPHFAISPSLWRVTSLVYPDFSEEEEEEEEEEQKREPEKKLNRKSFSCCFETDHDHHGHEKNRLSSSDEDKMDMLWEDFNEELQRVSSMDAKKLNHRHLQAEKSSSESCRHVRMKQQQVCCVKAMKGSNNTERRIIFQPKRYNNFVLLAKVLKKIFMIQNSRKINNRR